MIRVKCPKCAKPLGVDDAKGGALIVCPGCATKFKLPATAAAPAPQPAPVAAAKAARAADDEDSNPYVLQSDPEPPPPPPKKRRKKGDDEEDGGDDLGRPKKKKKKKLVEAVLETSQFLIILGCVAVLTITMIVLAFVHVYGSYAALGFGALVLVIARIWYEIILAEEEWATKMMFNWLPPYTLYFLVLNIHRAWQPIVLAFAATLMVGFGGLGVLFIHDEPPPKPQTSGQKESTPAATPPSGAARPETPAPPGQQTPGKPTAAPKALRSQ